MAKTKVVLIAKVVVVKGATIVVVRVIRGIAQRGIAKLGVNIEKVSLG